jgi:hypothetical protein
VRPPEQLWPPAAVVVCGWVIAVAVAVAADGYDRAPAWLLLIDLAVLLPVAVGSAYWIGRTLGGDVLATWFAAVLVLLPPAGLLYATSPFRDVYVDRVLVEAVGVADSGAFAAGALLVLAAALVVRSLAGDPRVAAAAGASASAAMLVEPRSALFLAGPVLAYALARRPVALGVVAVVAAVGVVATLLLRDADPGLDVSWAAFSGNMASLREYLWSNRVVQWLPIAGTIGLALRSPPVAGLIGGWFGAFAVAEGASPNLPVGDGTFFVAFVPALPAFALLVAALPLLVPGVAARFAARDALLEERQPLGEDRGLVGELRDDRRVVQQHEQDEERGDREQDRGRIGRDADPAGDGVQPAAPR